MKKIIILVLFLTMAAVLSGCRGFLAVSISKKTEGGIYCIEKSAKQTLSLPTMNYLIPGKNYYYGTSNRMPGSKSRNGAVSVLDRIHIPHCDSGVLQSVSAEGKTPCHLTLSPDETHLYTANYSSGDISEFRLKEGKVVSAPRLIKHTGRSITKRQLSPHPHYVGFSPCGKQLFVSDLGTDEIWIYNYLPEKGLLLPCAEKLKLPAGAGPRHLIFSPCGKILYTANELNSTASSFVKRNGKWQLFKTLSTLKPGTVVKRNSPGAIKITENGKFFFITNRGHNSVAFFETDGKGDFKLLDTVSAEGDFPSDILLIDNETRLAVSHLKSGTVNFLKFDKKTKTLTPETDSCNVPQAIGLCLK